MAKIPVGATIAQAWHFVVHDFFRILGVMWLPLLAMWLPSLVMHMRAMALGGDMGYAGMAQMWRLLLPLDLIAFFFLFMQMIGIAELALGRRQGPSWVYFSFAKPVWRLVGSFLFLMLVLVIGAIASLLVNLLLGYIGKTLLGGAGGAAAVIGGLAVFLGSLALWCAYLYALVRLSFLLVPVIAAREPGFALARGWTLGRGNFWRMFAILLTLWIPLLVLELILVFGVMFRGVTFPPPGAGPAQKLAFQAMMNQHAAQLVNGLFSYWYLLLPVCLVIMVLFYGFGIAAQCFAWRALTDGSAPVAGDSLPD